MRTEVCNLEEVTYLTWASNTVSFLFPFQRWLCQIVSPFSLKSPTSTPFPLSADGFVYFKEKVNANGQELPCLVTINSTILFPNPHNLFSLVLKWKNCPLAHLRPVCPLMLWIPSSTACSRISSLQSTSFLLYHLLFPFYCIIPTYKVTLTSIIHLKKTFHNLMSHPVSISPFASKTPSVF